MCSYFEKGLNKNLLIENNSIQRDLIKLLNTPFTPSKITAANDYYTYINYQWISGQTTQLQKQQKKDNKFYVQIDSFRLAQERVYYELIDLTKEYIKANDSAKSNAIKNLYESMLHLDEKEAELSIKYTVEHIDTFMANNDLYKLLGQINQNETIAWGCPIAWSVLKDKKHSIIIRTISEKNNKSKGNACRILHFLVNSPKN